MKVFEIETRQVFTLKDGKISVFTLKDGKIKWEEFNIYFQWSLHNIPFVWKIKLLSLSFFSSFFFLLKIGGNVIG